MRPRASTAPLLVLAAVVSVQVGGALAAKLVPLIGAAGSVTLRLAFATVVLLAVARPRLRGHSRTAWRTVVGFGVVLGAMNLTFYGSLAHLPLGVAVTIEFLGPLALAASQSRRGRDWLAVGVAAAGVVLVSGALETSWAELDRVGILLALAAGALWAAYIMLSQRAGSEFAQLDGLALAMVVATVVVLPLGVGTVPDWTARIVGVGFAIAIFSSVLPYSLELVALRRLRQQVFGILLSLEPAVAALAGLLVLGQVLDTVQLVGIGCVVAASVIVLGTERRAHRPDPAETTST